MQQSIRSRGTHLDECVCIYFSSVAFRFFYHTLWACTLFIISYLKRHVFNCTHRDNVRARPNAYRVHFFVSQLLYDIQRSHEHCVCTVACCLRVSSEYMRVLFVLLLLLFRFISIFSCSLHFVPFRFGFMHWPGAAAHKYMYMHVFLPRVGTEYIRWAGFWYMIIYGLFAIELTTRFALAHVSKQTKRSQRNNRYTHF